MKLVQYAPLGTAGGGKTPASPNDEGGETGGIARDETGDDRYRRARVEGGAVTTTTMTTRHRLGMGEDAGEGEEEGLIAGTMEIGTRRIPCTRNCRRMIVLSLGTLLASVVLLVVGTAHRDEREKSASDDEKRSIDDYVRDKKMRGDDAPAESDAELAEIVDDGKTLKNAHLADENFPENPFGYSSNNASSGLGNDVSLIHGVNRTVSCFPASVCYQRRHFISDATRMADNKAFMVLSSFPGSGNTWTRSVIEEGTRIWTGSIYSDSALYNDGFKGEMINSYGRKYPKTIVVKTHYPCYGEGFRVNRKVTAGIHVMRSPFDAFFSEFNREYTKGHSHTAAATVTTVQKKFANWIEDHKAMWKLTIDMWVGAKPHTNFTTTADGVTYSHTMRKGIKPDGHLIEVLVLFYEDFVVNFHTTTKLMFSFLKSRLGDVMPPVDDAVACAEARLNNESKEKRSHADAYNPYRDPKGGIMHRHLIRKWCEELAPYWYEEKWGNCTEAALQRERHVKRVLPPYVDEKNVCPKPTSADGTTASPTTTSP